MNLYFHSLHISTERMNLVMLPEGPRIVIIVFYMYTFFFVVRKKMARWS